MDDLTPHLGTGAASLAAAVLFIRQQIGELARRIEGSAPSAELERLRTQLAQQYDRLRECDRAISECSSRHERQLAEARTSMDARMADLDKSRPTHADLEQLTGEVRRHDNQLVRIEAKMTELEKGISRIAHTLASTSSMVQLLVLNSHSISAAEKAAILNSTITKEHDGK